MTLGISSPSHLAKQYRLTQLRPPHSVERTSQPAPLNRIDTVTNYPSAFYASQTGQSAFQDSHVVWHSHFNPTIGRYLLFMFVRPGLQAAVFSQR